jgi:5-methylcytosine-specific restriction endonuclease McrA
MLNPKHIGDCNRCGKKSVQIAGGWSTRADKRCVSCERARKKAKEGENLKRRMQKPWKLLCPKIWASRPHRCIECQAQLVAPLAIHFSHVLSRGSHPELAADPDNIVLHCAKCHRKWEAGKKDEMPETLKALERIKKKHSK